MGDELSALSFFLFFNQPYLMVSPPLSSNRTCCGGGRGVAPRGVVGFNILLPLVVEAGLTLRLAAAVFLKPFRLGEVVVMVMTRITG